MPEPTADPAYARRLAERQGVGWKRWAPNPYRWYLRHLRLGRTLEVGCGVGRILGYLAPDAIGVDHNADAVARCRVAGFEAYTPAELAAGSHEPFDALVLAHVLEHLDADGGRRLVAEHLPRLRPGARVVLICPQARGQGSDPTHMRFYDRSALVALCGQLGLEVVTARSFPLPRLAGRWFVYNETVVIGRVPTST